VSQVLPDHLLEVGRVRQEKKLPHRPVPLSSYARRLQPFLPPSSTRPIRAFRANLAALDLFPTTLWAQVAARRMRRVSTHLLPVDEEGLDWERGLRRHSRARLVYVTPAHQFPLGVTMSLRRRLALLEWARRSGTLIFEDDYDSEYRYSARPIPALQGLDPSGVVIFAGSFSAVLFPALRLGYLVVPAELVAVFAAAESV